MRPTSLVILADRGGFVGVELLDHIIFNRTGYFSFLEEGQL
jgi:DNA repair protein RadC